MCHVIYVSVLSSPYVCAKNSYFGIGSQFHLLGNCCSLVFSHSKESLTGKFYCSVSFFFVWNSLSNLNKVRIINCKHNNYMEGPGITQ